MTRRLHRAAVPAIVLTSALLLSGCSTPPWDQPQFRKTSPSASAASSTPASASAAPSHTPEVIPTITKIHNDLEEGSASHVLKAGDLTVKVTYWSTLAMNEWTPSADKPLSVSLSAVPAAGSKNGVYLTEATLNVSVAGAKGAGLPAPRSETDHASVSPGYEVVSPYSYGQTFIVSAVASTAASLTFTFTYSLIEETTPTSDIYAKQTAVDTLTVALQ